MITPEALERCRRVRHAMLGGGPMGRPYLRELTQPMTSNDFDAAMHRCLKAHMVVIVPGLGFALTRFGERVALGELEGVERC